MVRCAEWKFREQLAPISAAAVALMMALGAPAAADDAPGGITFQQRGYGWILSNAEGMTLYTYTRDLTPGASACIDECSEQWPPLAAGADAKNSGEWSLIVRPDETRQWAYRDKPLYLSTRDRSPGDTFGDSVSPQWVVALKPIPLPPAIHFGPSPIGHVLIDGRRLTLYTSSDDPPGQSTCDARCATTWKALRAPWTAKSDTVADWSVIARDDGTRQWAFKSKAVYTYDGDVMPGHTYGHGVDGRAAVVLEPLPPNPSWVTYHPSDGGVLICDENGATIYMLDAGRRGGRGGAIERPQDWKPVIAKPDATPIGNWAIIDNEGVRQWTHKGLPVYTHVLDTRPGQLHGVRSTDAMWRTITRSGQMMEGAGPN